MTNVSKTTLLSYRDPLKNGFFFGCESCSGKFVSNKALKSHTCLKQEKLVQGLKSFSKTKAVLIIAKQEVNQSRETLSSIDANEARHTSEESKPITVEKEQNKEKQVNAENPKYFQFYCTICGRGHISTNSQEEHMRTHTKDIPCQDPGRDCKLKFYTKKELWSHMLIVHGIKYQQGMTLIYKCDQCDYKNNKSKVRLHMGKHTDVKNSVCSYCGKLFKDQKILKTHMKYHTSKFESSCTICDKAFVSLGHLNFHMKTAHSTQRYVCFECGKHYKSPYDLTIHITIHTGEKKIKCREGCEKTFRYHAVRDKLERTHRGVKEFKCNICPKEFMQRISLKYHMGNHEGRKDYKCKTCGEAYVEPRRARNCKHNVANLKF